DQPGQSGKQGERAPTGTGEYAVNATLPAVPPADDSDARADSRHRHRARGRQHVSHTAFGAGGATAISRDCRCATRVAGALGTAGRRTGTGTPDYFTRVARRSGAIAFGPDDA